MSNEKPTKSSETTRKSEAPKGAATPPSFIRKTSAPRGLEGIDPAGLPWPGDDRQLDWEALTKEVGLDPDPPLVMLLKAIIAAHPAASPKPGSRLQIAMKALTGRKHDRSNKERPDNQALLNTAVEYLRQYWAQGGKDPELRPIVAKALATTPEFSKLKSEASKQSRIQVVERKLKRRRKVLLVQASQQNVYERMDVIKSVRTILRQMSDLGIPSDRDFVQPLLPQRDSKSKKE